MRSTTTTTLLLLPWTRQPIQLHPCILPQVVIFLVCYKQHENQYENRYALTDEGRVDLRKSNLIFEAPKVLLVRSSFGRAGEPVLSPTSVQLVWVCASCLKRALCEKRAIHHGPSPAKPCKAYTWLRSKIGRDNATDQVEIWDQPAESSERS